MSLLGLFAARGKETQQGILRNLVDQNYVAIDGLIYIAIDKKENSLQIGLPF